MEIFTFITGVIYIILEIRQKSSMWLVGVLTSLAAMWVFFSQGLYASFALNTYYLVTAFIGLWQWGKNRRSLKTSCPDGGSEDVIHLNKLTWKTIALSAVSVVAGTALLSWVMEMFENPMSVMDASVAVLSAVATWWLVKSYLEQWLLWVVADMMLAVMCAVQGLWWMTVLYAAYTIAAVYGYFHWRRHGQLCR